MPVVYKILFEVKLMHEYYLTNKDGNTIFEKNSQADRLAMLEEYYTRGVPSVTEVLDFEFPSSLKSVYESYYLKLLPAYSGFKLAVRVNLKTLEDGTIVYSPYVKLPTDLNIYISLVKKNKGIDNVTNSRINPPLTSTYFFSNNNVSSTWPFLTNPVSPFNANYSYEQGEIVSFGDNDIRSYFQNGAGDHWQEFKGTGFASENDRLLVPFQFNYSFPRDTNVKDAEFFLLSQQGQLIKSIQVNGSDALKNIRLDFSDKKELLDTTPLLRNNLFNLQVNGQGFSRMHSLFFSSLYNRSMWAVAAVTVQAANADFNVVDNDGYLLTRRKPTENVPAPIFEIPIKARLAYWRYANERKKQILINPSLAGFLTDEDAGPGISIKRLVSITPRSISRENLSMTQEGTALRKYFPNPMGEIMIDRDDRLYYDIVVPRSDLFPTS